MSQQDFNISTADANTGITYRAAVNAALQALASTSSGSSEPSTKYAFQIWADTANDLLKIRNSANTAWISFMVISAGRPVYIPSTLSSAELGYLDGVTSSIQTQLNAKSPIDSPTFTGPVTLPSTTSIGNVSGTELSYVDGVTSAIQPQLNAKQATLVSGTSIKTINSASLLGSGNISVLTSVPAATNTVYGGIKVSLSGETLTIVV